MQAILKNLENNINNCTICPRNCTIDRTSHLGYCRCSEDIIISRISRHFGEEPCICSEKGAGTIFFSGCNMHCIFCQNYSISSNPKGKKVSIDELTDYFLRLQEMECSVIDLITPTHYTTQIIKALDKVKYKLNIPVVYNCSGYEKLETLQMLNGYIDIFLPDFKYFYTETAKNYSNAPNYPEITKKAIKKMLEITGNLQFDEDNMLKKGVIVRHLCLPGHRHESMEIIDWLGKNFNKNQIIISLMSQFTPVIETKYKNLNRHITKMEYNSVVKKLEEYDFNGYIQSINSAKKKYIPDFEDLGIMSNYL